MEFGECLKSKIIQYKIATPQELVGCSRVEIEEIMVAQEVKFLPPVYVSFLEHLGKGAGKFLKQDFWSKYTYPDLLFMKRDPYETLPHDDAFLFWTDGVFMSKYFLTGEANANPHIYLVSDTFNDAMGHTLLDDFLYFTKHYEGNEIYRELVVQFQIV